MRLSPVPQLLLVLLSIVALTRAQTTTQTSAIANTATTWTAPAIFYPFGSAAGDTETFESGGETYQYVSFSTPFTFFGHTYNSIYVNNNGLLTFNQPIPEAHPFIIPSFGVDDFIAALWTELDDIGFGKYWYQQYTSGSVLTRATEDINQYFPQLNFIASSVFVVTWDYVQTFDVNVFNLRSAPTITFQAVLISGGDFSFILMNYGDCADVVPYPVEAGYDTIGSTDYHVIHYANDGYSISNLKTTSNVDVLGRWAFLVNNGTANTTVSTTTTAWTAPAIFYPFGSAAGDTETFESGGETYQYVSFSTPFTFFGHTYNSIYVNNNGLLTFNQPIPEAHPFIIPSFGVDDFIAPLWTELDDIGFGKYWYQQYTSGSVLTRATEDINQYFPQLNFTASSVFVVTWDYVQTFDVNVFNLRSAPTITFQAVLISGGDFSFILMNYGDCADVVPYPAEAGYDTIGSTNYHVIHYANDGYSISHLKNTSNVDVLGRWAFLVNNGTANTTVSTTTTAWTAPAIFYPFGLAAGDGEQLETGYETFVNFTFSTPFTFFGRKYNYVYVNNNGLLTFNQPIPEAHPFIIPSFGVDDFIAPLWTELDDIGFGKYWYQQYTSGSVLTRASQDINQYFPHIGFTASSVFVATWDYVQTFDMNVFNLRSAPTITFQVVLISGGGFSFILMNYGDCADVVPYPAEAGYDTIGSTDYHVIHYANDGYSISHLKNTSNVDVLGRWAFLVNNGTENVLGVQIKLSSFLDLTQTGNIEDVLQQIKQELVNRGASSFFDIKLRNVKKKQP